MSARNLRSGILVTKKIPGRQKNSKPGNVNVHFDAETAEAKGSHSQEQSPSPKIVKFEPKDWQVVLENIRQMMKKTTIKVEDKSEKTVVEQNIKPEEHRYQILISLMLSSQTKDQVTNAAMERLKSQGLTIQNILDMDDSTLGEMIKPVLFWRKKVTYIKKTTQILRDKYNDDIPNTVEGLSSLPGVGPKMTIICMNEAWGQNVGIGVDTHVHRVSNRLKWTGPQETKNPDKTRTVLESWLPSDLWQEVDITLVRFGQSICLPINPKCSECLNNKLCPYGKTSSNKSSHQANAAAGTSTS